MPEARAGRIADNDAVDPTTDEPVPIGEISLAEDTPREKSDAGERDCVGGRHDGRRGKDDDDAGSAPTTIVTRTVDGSGNNTDYADWGATHQQIIRLAPADYEDGWGEMVTDRPNARAISNAVAQQTEDEPNSFGISDFFWAWGQFIDHDLDLTEAVAGGEDASIIAPLGDEIAVIPFTRVTPIDGTGLDAPREYENEITAFMDASMVYGSDEDTAAALRTGAYLLLQDNGLLVETESGVLAGDVRAAENIALTSLHTLFAREHNRWVDELAAEDPDLTEDALFDAARMRVEAEIQAITYNDWLPILLGDGALDAYRGYDPDVNPGISVEFSTAAFRFGHTLLSSDLSRLNEDGSEISAGAIALRDAFFNPTAIAENGGIDPILRGLGDQTAQELDTHVVEDVRSFLFAEGSAFGLDLASLNIQRGRDLGVAAYNDLREALGLSRAESFDDITSDEDLADTLAGIYGDVDLVDAWVGGLAEDAFGGGMVGELFATIIIDQFERIRAGDALWSEAGQFDPAELAALWDTTLADVIEANTDIDAIQQEVFYAYDRQAGTEANEELTGTDGRDLLLGLGGDDTLNGGAGDDQLEGGDGADLFMFIGDFGHDVIGDFGEGDSVLIDLYGGGEGGPDGNRGSGPHLPSLVQDGDDVVLELRNGSSITWLDATVNQIEDDIDVI
ncbi:MAG: peroxidase family protein [Pseudomonadota bacterium]